MENDSYNIYSFIENYTNTVQTSRNRVLNNMKDIVDTMTDVSNREYRYFSNQFSSITDDWFERISALNDRYFSSLDIPGWTSWYNSYLEDEERHKKDGHNFNVFDLLHRECGFQVQETAHSKLIKFLLNPHETHGQGKRFLIEFLRLIEICDPEKGNWNITAEEGKIDILLRRNDPESVIIIENKSNGASDQPNQLYRYWHQAIYLRTKEVSKDFYNSHKNQYQIIYLTPNSEKKLTEQSITKPQNLLDDLPTKLPMDIKLLTFDKDIQKWLEKCQTALSDSNRVKEYIEQYKIVCTNL